MALILSMDSLSKLRPLKVLLIIVGLVSLMVAYLDDAWSMLNLPGLMLVILGVFGAGLLGSKTKDFFRLIKISCIELFDGRVDIRQDIDEIVYVSKLWHEKKIKAVEEELSNIANPFLRYAIELIIDNTPIPEVHSLLRWRAHRLRNNEQILVQIAQSMASYAPAFGMLGTILGLINMLGALDEQNIEAIGTSMAIALLTTLYGILLANILFKPIAHRLQQRIDSRLNIIALIMEGVELIHHDRSPALLYSTLHSIIIDHSDELRDGKYANNHNKEMQHYRDLLGIKK